MTLAQRFAPLLLCFPLVAPSSGAAQLFDWADETYAGLRGGYTIGEFEGDRTSNAGTNFDYEADEASIEFSAFGGARFLDFGLVEIETYLGFDTQSDLEERNGGALNREFERDTTSFGLLANVGLAYEIDRFRLKGLAGAGFGFRNVRLRDGAVETDFEASGGLVYQGLVGGEYAINDHWSAELSAAYRVEPDLEYEDLFTSNDSLDFDSRGVTRFGLGFVYRFGGGGGSSPPVSDGFVRPASFDGFPPAAEPRRTSDRVIRPASSLSPGAAPRPRAVGELEELRARLAALEERADDLARVRPRNDTPASPRFSAGSPDLVLTPSAPPAAPPPPAAVAAPFVPPPLTPGAQPNAAPAASSSARSMADIAAEMRGVIGDVSGAPAPADPLFGLTMAAPQSSEATRPASGDHYVAVAQSADADGAEAAWLQANARMPDLLAGIPAAVEDWAVGGPRIHAGPLDATAAQSLCAAIRARGERCSVASGRSLGFENAL